MTIVGKLLRKMKENIMRENVLDFVIVDEYLRGKKKSKQINKKIMRMLKTENNDLNKKRIVENDGNKK